MPGPLPCAPFAAAVVTWQGLAGAVCPQPSGPAAQTGNERTSWHSLFLYRQEVGVATGLMPRIIECFFKPATCREKKIQIYHLFNEQCIKHLIKQTAFSCCSNTMWYFLGSTSIVERDESGCLYPGYQNVITSLPKLLPPPFILIKERVPAPASLNPSFTTYWMAHYPHTEDSQTETS